MIEERKFAGTWATRLENLFEAGVGFGAKSVLDAGCNMGIVGYEICKQGPAFYQGVDILAGHVDVARAVFLGVPVESRFDAGDLTDMGVRQALLRPAYDVVLYLAVHHHIRRVAGDAAARAVASDLFARSSGHLIFRGPDLDDIRAIAAENGFEVAAAFPRGRHNPLCAFRRRADQA
jgi:2-polyprenyl-3-methyl-5-hydroxy-6-metoxy-1,4-benzoquinol methylase